MYTSESRSVFVSVVRCALTSLALVAAGLIGTASAQPRFDAVRHFGDFSSTTERLVVGDFDGDGHLDVANIGAREGDGSAVALVTFAGDGTGDFRRVGALPLPANGYYDRAAAADFDGDGDDDIAASSAVDTERIEVFFGNGAFGFTSPVIVPLPSYVTALAAADLGGNGRSEFIATDHFHHVFVLKSDGLSGITVDRYDTAGGEGLPVFADVDGNGALDVIVPRQGCWEIHCGQLSGYDLLLGDHYGRLRPAQARRLGDDVSEIAAADFDGDGFPDLAILSSTGQLLTARGDGAGNFASPVIVHQFEFAMNLSAMDLDADGRADLLLGFAREFTPPLDSGMTWLLGHGEGSFDAPRHAHLSGELILADVVEDGIPDVVAFGGSGFGVHAGRGGRGFDATPDVSTGAALDDFTLVDIDEDGFLDVVSWSRTFPFTCSTRLADGLGSFPRTVNSITRGGTRAVGDLSGDGHADVAVELNDSSDGMEVRWGYGNGSFRVGPRISTGIQPRNSSLGAILDDILCIDVDADGSRELLVAGANGARVLRRHDDWSFDAGPIFPLLQTRGRLIAVDMNGDGRPELVGIEPNASTIYSRLTTWRSDATGVFSQIGPDEWLPRFPGLPVAADFDEDGRVDLAIAARGGGGGILVCRGNGDGTVQQRVRVIASSGFECIVAADVDHDGHQDLAAAGGEIWILSGDGHGGFLPTDAFRAGDRPTALAAVDLERDGDLDLLELDANSRSLWILHNRTVQPYLDARRGNVNASTGSVTNVLFANGSAGQGAERRVVVDRTAAFEIRVAAPPSRSGSRAPFVMWAWPTIPRSDTISRLPGGLGFVPMPTPITPSQMPQPSLIANNLGYRRTLGRENWPTPSAAAPSLLLSVSNGLRRTGRFYMQGIILDGAGPNGVSALTNGIEFVVR
ncbi:MAG: VCBS repeat-containing protein [Planctomycetes bacterium]|nr:VCBS repeat-containing protein [Planctomycetota bacterium]